MTLYPHPLWHGTSAHLLPMIEQHGLGGRNVLAEWRVMDFLASAFPFLNFDSNDYSDPDYEEKMLIDACLRQVNAGMNFLYGDVYAAGGFDKAASYARYAPEMISFVRMAVEMADRYEIATVRNCLKDYPEISQFLELGPKPVVLKLPPIPLSSLQDEKGGNIPSFLFDEGQASEALLSQWAFRVGAIVPLSEIEVLHLET